MNYPKNLRRQLEQDLIEIERRLENIDRDRRRESAPLDDDWDEQASVRQNDEVLDSLDEEEQQKLSAIRTALARMDAGTYGICSQCGKGIGKARLDALPHAALCVRCAGDQDSGADSTPPICLLEAA